MRNIAGYIGRQTIARVDHYLALAAFFSRMVRLFFVRSGKGRTILFHIINEQIYFTAVQALPLLIPVAVLIGTMMIIQFSEASAQYDLGKLTVMLVMREFGPLITALVVILRSATAVSIEMGYMNVLHEMESIQMQGIDPVDAICLPRLIGITLSVICLVVLFDMVAVLGGYALAWALTDIPLQNFLDQIGQALTGMDIIIILLKALFFGMGITIISLFRGFTVEKGITEVPISTSRGAVECLLFCIFVDFFVFICGG
jgi:phospholipid/cholesterol/gamma-HCH transport system permease protein